MSITESVLIRLLFTLTAGCGAVAFTGCAEEMAGQSQSHAEGDEHGIDVKHGSTGEGEAKSFVDRVAELSKMKDVICEAFADGTPGDAHDALHDVGHLLEALPKLASSELNLDEEALKSLDAAIESLFDGFGQLDETFHGGEDVDADQIGKDLTQALEQLKAAVH